MDNNPTSQDLSEANRFLSWENEQLRLEVKALQGWIDSRLQLEFEKVQMFGPSRATLRHSIKKLEESVRGLKHELAESIKVKLELQSELREKEEEIFKLTLTNSVVIKNSEAMTDQVMVAEEAMQGPNSLETYHAELAKLAQKPPVVPRATFPPPTKSYLRRLNLTNSLTSLSEDFSLSHVTANSRPTRSRDVRSTPTQAPPTSSRPNRSRSRSSRSSRSRTSFRSSDSSAILAENRRLQLCARMQ